MSEDTAGIVGEQAENWRSELEARICPECGGPARVPAAGPCATHFAQEVPYTEQQAQRYALVAFWGEDTVPSESFYARLFNAGWDARGEYERNRSIPDAEVEAAAKAMAEQQNAGKPAWAELEPPGRELWCVNARAVLSAAREVAPKLAPGTSEPNIKTPE